MVTKRQGVTMPPRPPTGWPPDDTEESVVGTNLHQATITNLRVGLNEVAAALAPPGQAAPGQALSQTIIRNFRRRMGMNKPIVVDSHHHFWDPARTRYPWMTDEMAAIRRPFGPDDLRPELAAAGVDYTVLIQTRSSEEETRAFMAIAAATPFIAGVVGWVDLTAPDVAERLAALKARPDGATLAGIRHQVHDEPDARWLLRDDVRRGLRAVRDAGLAYDLLVRTRELPAALETVRAFPDLRVVIDHIAKPPIQSGEIAAWVAALAPFKEQERVYCKLSGIVTEADWRDWTARDLQPYIDRVVTIFGEDRLMFGSDWPVCLLAASYTTVYATLRDALRGLSPSARDKVFGANAIKFYQLILEAQPCESAWGEQEHDDTHHRDEDESHENLVGGTLWPDSKHVD